MNAEIRIRGLDGIPLVRPGDDVGMLLVDAIRRLPAPPLASGDLLVVASKIISKSEGCFIPLAGVEPSTEAVDVAAQIQRDARKVEVILSQSRRVLRTAPPTRTRPGVIICETHHGFVCANAGVDESNLSEPDTVLTLPEDPDKSAAGIRETIRRELEADVGVIVSDTFGRPWRRGLVNVAIGVAGFPSIVDLRGKKDYAGRELMVTEIATADEAAAVAGLTMGKLNQVPAALIQGLAPMGAPGSGADIIRPPEDDLFR